MAQLLKIIQTYFQQKCVCSKSKTVLDIVSALSLFRTETSNSLQQYCENPGILYNTIRSV